MNILKNIEQYGIKERELTNYLLNGGWYHSISFGSKLKSGGVYSHQEHLRQYAFPASLENKTVLDVGCSDGFFSFEFEKRKAKTILAVDTNKFDGGLAISPSPARKKDYEKKYRSYHERSAVFMDIAKKLGFDQVHNFFIAKKILDSSVEYRDCSIYDIDTLGRTFDIVFCGDLIEHLKNPIEAVEKLCVVTKELCIISLSSVEAAPKQIPLVNLIPRFRNRLVTYWGDSGGSFFHFSAGAFKRLVLTSGFSRVEIVSQFKMKNFRTGEMNRHAIYHCWK
jgi:SAM-dependent methyltransferase